MPELPEVEVVKNQLAPKLVGAAVTNAWSHTSDKFTPALELIGSEFTNIERRGKFILVETDSSKEFIIHLGMTGKVSFCDEIDDNPYRRAWLELENSEYRFMEYVDVRRFGRLRLVDKGDYSSTATLKDMGPEPFDQSFTADEFYDRLSKSRRPIKTQLLSQKPVAGVGNIYADEALWLSKINPLSKRISKERSAALLDAVRIVLQKGIDNGGTTLRDYRNADGETGANQYELAAYGRSGEPCLRCSTILKSASIDARTTTWCTNCQR